jgi:WD40 repeat protein
LLIGYTDGIIIIFDLLSDKEVIKFEAHLAEVSLIKSIDISNEQLIVSSSKNNQLFIWDILTGEII